MSYLRVHHFSRLQLVSFYDFYSLIFFPPFSCIISCAWNIKPNRKYCVLLRNGNVQRLREWVYEGLPRWKASLFVFIVKKAWKNEFHNGLFAEDQNVLEKGSIEALFDLNWNESNRFTQLRENYWLPARRPQTQSIFWNTQGALQQSNSKPQKC